VRAKDLAAALAAFPGPGGGSSPIIQAHASRRRSPWAAIFSSDTLLRYRSAATRSLRPRRLPQLSGNCLRERRPLVVGHSNTIGLIIEALGGPKNGRPLRCGVRHPFFVLELAPAAPVRLLRASYGAADPPGCGELQAFDVMRQRASEAASSPPAAAGG